MKRTHGPDAAVAPAAHAVLAFAALALAIGPLAAVDYDEPPISYSSCTPADAINRLIGDLDAGKVRLRFDARFGYLPSLLEALAVPASSQVLVFSKTSLQKDCISPATPRALYFNDEVYVGTVVGGAVMELAATDPRQGTMFYVLDQRERAHPRPLRQTQECLQCHDSTAFTGGVPGLIMRSVFPDDRGQAILTLGTGITTPASPWDGRWGGWYVTGTYGRMRHLGNQVYTEQTDLAAINRAPGANLTTLDRFINPDLYLRPTSDVVALMALSHQIQVHNLITRSGFEARIALRDEQVMNEALDRPSGHRSDSTTRRLRYAADALVKSVLFAEDVPFADPVAGTSGFAEEFSQRGPRNRRGVSLHALDLRQRFARLPCSYLIQSDAFAALPPELKTVVYGQIRDVVTGHGWNERFARISQDDCTGILTVLQDTLSDLPPFGTTARGSR